MKYAAIAIILFVVWALVAVGLYYFVPWNVM